MTYTHYEIIYEWRGKRTGLVICQHQVEGYLRQLKSNKDIIIIDVCIYMPEE